MGVVQRIRDLGFKKKKKKLSRTPKIAHAICLQDLLMAQQQQQLLQLREEQERVHRVMAQQKQMQWGGASSRTGHALISLFEVPLKNRVETKQKHSLLWRTCDVFWEQDSGGGGALKQRTTRMRGRSVSHSRCFRKTESQGFLWISRSSENGVRSSPKKETTKTTSVTSPKRSEGHQIVSFISNITFCCAVSAEEEMLLISQTSSDSISLSGLRIFHRIGASVSVRCSYSLQLLLCCRMDVQRQYFHAAHQHQKSSEKWATRTLTATRPLCLPETWKTSRMTAFVQSQTQIRRLTKFPSSKTVYLRTALRLVGLMMAPPTLPIRLSWTSRAKHNRCSFWLSWLLRKISRHIQIIFFQMRRCPTVLSVCHIWPNSSIWLDYTLHWYRPYCSRDSLEAQCRMRPHEARTRLECHTRIQWKWKRK